MSKRAEQKAITAKDYDNITGYITFGPKDNSLCRAGICYVPTEEQIKNLKEFFGWDYVPAFAVDLADELIKQLKEK